MNLISRLSVVALILIISIVTACADIIENLSSRDATVTIEQPKALVERLRNAESMLPESSAEDNFEEEKETEVHRPQGRVVGYRVQVYADNNQRVAKGEARQREKVISQKFPSLMTYVAYASPYWRLRVGDFRSQAEAEKVASDIRHAFPAYAKEVRVVRDHINAR